MSRVYLSPPHLGSRELELVREAFASNWIAPIGPHLDALEAEIAEYVGVRGACAVASGTAALHLALRGLGVGRGDVVLCSTLTFCASSNPIVYQGATPVFVDSDPETWNLSPALVADELARGSRGGSLPRAVVAVDLYGQCADYEALEGVCAEYDVPLIEDAAEALGATYRGRQAGSFGRCGVFSLNGNKIITASSGGILVSNDTALVERARHLATQARDPAAHYEHSELGYNYRMSNVLAAIARGQLEVLGSRVEARRGNFEAYQGALGGLPGVEFMPEASFGRATRWLTVMTIDPQAFGASREDVRLALAGEDIEARPVWKPMHLQPLYRGSRVVGGAFAERLFERGLCLPSGSDLSAEDRQRVIDLVRAQCRG